MKQLPATGFIRTSELLGNPKAKVPIAAIIPVSRTTLWRWVRTGNFPAPVKTASHATAFRVEDIRAWIEKSGSGCIQIMTGRSAKKSASDDSNVGESSFIEVPPNKTSEQVTWDLYVAAQNAVAVTRSLRNGQSNPGALTRELVNLSDQLRDGALRLSEVIPPPLSGDSKTPVSSVDLLTEVEAAGILRVRVQTLRNWRSRGIGPRYHKIGARMVRYRGSDLATFVESGS